jgi:hypothetical protein
MIAPSKKINSELPSAGNLEDVVKNVKRKKKTEADFG